LRNYFMSFLSLHVVSWFRYWACAVLMLIVASSNARAFYDHAKALRPILMGAAKAKAP